MVELRTIEENDSPLPLQPWHGFQDTRYYINQMIYNPSKARKNALHLIFPKLFSSPNRNYLKQNINKQQIKVNKERIQKKDNIEEKVEKENGVNQHKKYKFKMKNKSLISVGAFGKIYSAQCLLKDERGTQRWENCAVKVMPVPGSMMPFHNCFHTYVLDDIVYKYEFESETNILRKLRGHEFILNLYHYSISRGKAYIATEFCSIGDFSDILAVCEKLPSHSRIKVKDGKLIPEYMVPRIPVKVLRLMFAPVFEAVAYLHSKGYVHRDIKPQNILLHADGNPKLCDFGACIKIQNTESEGFNKGWSGYVGSSYYMAPEVVCGEAYGHSMDSWSLGMSLLVLTYGWSPYHFRKRNVAWSVKEVKDAKGRTMTHWYKYELNKKSFQHHESEIWAKMGLNESLESEKESHWREFVIFLQSVFIRNQRDRPTVVDCLYSPFLSNVIKDYYHSNRGHKDKYWKQYMIVIDNMKKIRKKQRQQ